SRQIPNVTLSYNNISLKANNGQSTFIIEGFKQSTIDKINKIIGDTLGSYIKNPIVLASDFAYTVLDCLSNTTDAQTLKTAIMSAIGNQLNSTNVIINGIKLNWSEIKPYLQISLPNTATSEQWTNGELSNVTLTYDGYTLHPSSKSSSDYEVTNFAEPSYNDLTDQIDQLPKLLAEKYTFPIQFYDCPITAYEFIGLSFVRENWVSIYVGMASNFEKEFNLSGNQQLITYNHIIYIGNSLSDFSATVSQEANGLSQQNNEIGYVPHFCTVTLTLCGVPLVLENKGGSTVLGAEDFGIPTTSNNINTFIQGVTKTLEQQIPSTINLEQKYSLQWCKQNPNKLLQIILSYVQTFAYQNGKIPVPINNQDILGSMNINLGSFKIILPAESSGKISVQVTPTYQDRFLSSVKGTFKTITLTGFNEDSEEYLDTEYTPYMKNAILSYLSSNSDVLGSPNSSFIDLIRQHKVGYKTLNNYKDFDDFKVSFTQLSSKDATDLKKSAEDYWLTSTLTSIQKIHFTNWNGSLNDVSHGWNSNSVETVDTGNLFTWTSPYSLSTIGLSIGTTSNSASISSDWVNEYNSVIATNFKTLGEEYTLPSTWAVQLSEQIANNSSNFGNSGESVSTFLSNWISE
ncbi:MAG: hypothetical protein IIT78_02630, partial [Mycoplasmataceae bacterium]|nr:hypothetical protein [Mycoplasmataceae bacterium]